MSARVHPRDQIVETRAAGHLERAGRKATCLGKVSGRVVIEEQRQGRSRKAGILRVDRGSGHELVRFVTVVQPVTIDEAVLQTREWNAASTALEREGATPAARFRVGDRDVRLDRVERGALLRPSTAPTTETATGRSPTADRARPATHHSPG